MMAEGVADGFPIVPGNHQLVASPKGTWISLIASQEIETMTSPWYSIAHLPVTGSADISATLTESASEVSRGNTVDFSAVVVNTGPASAPDASVDLKLPPELGYVSSDNPSAAYDTQNRTVTAPVGTLAAGTSASVSVTCQATTEAASVAIDAIASSDEFDLDLSNNESAVNLAITVELGMPDLSGSWVPPASASASRASGAANAKTGSRPSHSWTIQTNGMEFSNQGTVASKDCGVSYYLSNDKVPDASDTLLRRDNLPPIAAGETLTQPVTLTYSGRTIQRKYVIAIVDPDDATPDANRTNNITVLGPLSSRRR
jgi:hypothetical protein